MTGLVDAGSVRTNFESFSRGDEGRCAQQMNESGSVCELGSKEWKHVTEKCTVKCIRKWEVGRVRVRMKCQCQCRC